MVSEQIMRILSECTTDGNVVRINSGQLDRKTYTEVNKVLEALGGKWNRKLQGHICDHDPSDALAAVVSTGEVPDKNPLAFFPTDGAALERILGAVMRYGVNNIRNILEPSAGDGAIVAELRRHLPYDVTITAVELDEHRAQTIRDRNLPNVEVITGDFLEWGSPDRYDVIAMNPPFRTADRPLAYVDHIRHAHTMLAESGMLISVTPIGWQYAGNRRRLTEFREWVENDGWSIGLPDDAFKHAGTMVKTCLVMLD